MDTIFPRLLIISNDCLSNTSSNGRTLRNFLIGWPKNKLAQFCLHNVSPDFEMCDNYYIVSDGDALQAFKSGKAALGNNSRKESIPNGQQSESKPRNAITMMARNLIWNSMRWAGKAFYQWVDEFAPEIILLQAGDCAFMLKLARKLARRYQIPLVIYNSEAYFFKRFDYFRAKGLAKWLYPIFRIHFCSEFKKTIKQAKHSIYICDKLKQDYDSEFGLPSSVIYTATQMPPSQIKTENKRLTISYLGNLGVGRHEGLIEIANALQSISSDLFLDVYGKLPNETVGDAFKECTGIHFKGFVSYDDVVRVMQQSDILVHTENFSDFYKEDLKYAFSTKISDSLASGTCFVLYAPASMACAEYLSHNSAAHVIDSKDKLMPTFMALVNDSCERNRFIEHAKELAKENHDSHKNAKQFQQLLCEIALSK